MHKIKKAFMKDWWKYLLAIGIVLIYCLPLFVLVNMSVKDITDVSSRLSLPDKIYWGNYRELFKERFIGHPGTGEGFQELF